MAARASCTERVLDVLRRAIASVPSWGLSAAGIAWGHAALVAATAIPAATPGIARIDHLSTAWLLAFEWTALLPLAITMAVVAGATGTLAGVSEHGLPLYALPLPALTGSALVVFTARLIRTPQTRPTVLPLLAALVATALFSTGAVSVSLVREHAAAQLFLEAVSTGEDPWRVASSRAAARTLVRRYPETVWASEAWRIIAIDAEVRGSRHEEAQAWRGFLASFEPYESAGRAVAALNLGRLTDGEPYDVAIGHYLSARHAVALSGPGVQRWIASQAARELERLALREGLYATAHYWASTSR